MSRFKGIYVIMLLVLFLSPAAAFAEQNAAATSSATDKENREHLMTFGEDRVFKGDNAKQDAYFEIGKNRTVLPGSTVDISFSHSPTLHPDYSTLTVLLDDIPIGSVSLDKTNTNVSDWKIDISDFDLQPGFHKLSFWAKLIVNAAVCEDPQNSSAWLTIRKDSKINLKIAEAGSSADLTIYPSPFIARGSSTPVQTVLVVPDSLTESEFKAAARLSQFLATQSTNGLLKMPIYTESDVSDDTLSGTSAIWIGNPDRWKGQGRTAIAAFNASHPEDEGLADSGVIGIATSPWDDERAIILITGNDDKLVRGAEILATESLYQQLQGSYSVIPDSLPDANKKAEDSTSQSYVLTFDKLGYGNLVTEDVMQGGSSIFYGIPSNWDLNDGAMLHLKYKHSKSILYNKSVMKVMLNGIPVQSANLVESTSDGGTLDIKLDPSVIGESRRLDIEVRFQFVNPTTIGVASPEEGNLCSSENLMGDWALIDKTSYFAFKPDKRANFNLDSLPFPFVAGNEWTDTTVVLGDKSTTELVAVMTLLGQSGTPITPHSDMKLASAKDPDLGQKLTDRNILFVGASAVLPPQLNGFGQSFVKFGDAGITSLSDDVPLLTELARNAAVMQLTESPINPDRSSLMISATGADELAYVGQALSDPAAKGAIAGRVVVIDDRKQVHAFPETAARSDASTPEADLEHGNRPLPYGEYVFIALLAIIVIVILIYVRRIRASK